MSDNEIRAAENRSAVPLTPAPTPPADDEPDLGDVVCFVCGKTANEVQLVQLRTTRSDIPFPRQGAKIRAEFGLPCGHTVAGWRLYDQEEGWTQEWRYTPLDWAPWDERYRLK